MFLSAVFSVVSVFAAAGLVSTDAELETRSRAAAAVVCGTGEEYSSCVSNSVSLWFEQLYVVFAGAVAVSGVLSGVRGLEHFHARLDRRAAVSPHKLSHTGTNNLPLQTRRSPAEENRLTDACENTS